MKLPWKSCVKIGVTIFCLYLAIHYWDGFAALVGTVIGASLPLIIGCVLAYLVNILMNAYERIYFPMSKKKFIVNSRRPIALFCALVSLIAIVALVVWLVLPELWSCIQLIFNLLPGMIEKGLAWVESLEILPEDIIDLLESMNWRSKIEQIVTMVVNGVGGVVDVAFKTVTGVFSGLVTALLAVIFALYLLLGKDKLAYQSCRLMKHYLNPALYNKVLYVIRILDDCFHRFIVGQCVEAVILGLLCTIGMLIFRFPYATMIGALVAFTALIPVAGAYIGAGVGAFMILTVSPFQALMFLIFIVVLQQLEGNLVYPRVVGSSIGLPGIWVLAAVTIGGGILGVGGMLIGVPLTATIYRILREDMQRHPKADDLPEEPISPEKETEEQNEASETVSTASETETVG